MNFSEKLRLARAKANMTQQQLSDATGISRRTIVSYETTGAKPRAGSLRKLSEALHVSFRYLMDDAVTDPTPRASIRNPQALKEAEKILASCSALFAGGELSPEEKDTLFVALAKAYLECKAEREAAKEDAENV